MNSCGVCDKSLPPTGESAVCCICCKKYHFDECSGLAANTWSSKSSLDKGKWKCKVCRSTGISTRGRLNADEKPSSDLSTEMKQGFSLIKDSLEKMFKEQFKSLNMQLSAVQESSAVTNNKITELSNSLEKMYGEVEQLRVANLKILQDHEILKKENADLKVQLNIQEQYSRNKNLEIHGFPEDINENTMEVVRSVITGIGLDAQKMDFVAHRLPKRDGKKGILIQFTSRAQRDLVLKEGRIQKIKLNDIKVNSPAVPIFFNENLNSYFKNLLYNVKKLIKERGFEGAWFSNSKIFVRKTRGSRPVSIKSLADFESIQ